MHGQTGFCFDLQCPQCGAPAELGETERIVDCPYCRVRHLTVTRPHPVSAIPPHPDLEESSTLYVPYWRFKGMALALVQDRIAHRLLDTSRLALSKSRLPPSLGLRSQTQRLLFVTPDMQGGFLRPAISRKGLLASLSSRQLGLGPRRSRDELVQAHVGDVLSLIYFPVLIRHGDVLDGLTGDHLAAPADELQQAERCGPPQTLSFLPALCPHCGWDLGGPGDSLVLPCEHCGRFWTDGRGQLRQVRCRCQPSTGQDSQSLPFWEFQVTSDTLPLSSYADLIRLANLPRPMSPAMHERPLVFRIPAFKINPALFLRLARQMTVVSLSQDDSAGQASGQTMFPVTLPAREAYHALPMLLCRLARDKRATAAALKKAKLKPKRVRLHYLAFSRRHGELVHDQAGLSLQENAIRFGRML
jgi:DNA-directed RNA polymerase subunit RPC12/RpoP